MHRFNGIGGINDFSYRLRIAKIHSGARSVVSVTDGVAGLNTLRAGLSRKEFLKREVFFNKAERFIQNTGAGGGAGPVKRSFFARGSDIRVDVEILRGFAFTPGARSDAAITPVVFD